MSRRARYLPKSVLVLSLAMAQIVLGCRSSSDSRPSSPKPTPVRCDLVGERSIETNLSLRGTVSARPNEDAVVSSAIPGRISSMRVTEGDTVAKGALLAVVENPSLGSDQETAAASISSAQATLKNAEQSLERERGLFAQGIAASRAVQDAETRVASAAADLAAARAQRRLAGRQSALAQVRAPIAGTVIKVRRGIGELVDGTTTTPIVEVANTSALELLCDVTSLDLVRLDEGASASIYLDALPGQLVNGKLVRVAPTVDPTTSLGRVRIELSPSTSVASRLRIGMSGQAIIATGRHRAIVVPSSAVRRSQDGQDQVVVCARRNGKYFASVKTVTVGERADTWVEITQGPSAGTLVVVDRALGLEDGTPLAPQRQEHPAEPAR